MNALQKKPPDLFRKKRCFAKFSRKHLYQGHVSACNFSKKETLAQVFSCEFREIYNNTFLTKHFRTNPSGSNAEKNMSKVTDKKNRQVYGIC